MSRTVNDVFVTCPFYKYFAKQSISCEGITEDCTIKLTFKSPQKRDLHRKIFCENKYKNCEIYAMLEKKYEEE